MSFNQDCFNSCRLVLCHPHESFILTAIQNVRMIILIIIIILKNYNLGHYITQCYCNQYNIADNSSPPNVSQNSCFGVSEPKHEGQSLCSTHSLHSIMHSRTTYRLQIYRLHRGHPPDLGNGKS